jgi:predicted alpha/beta-hydrolase family hydrolase
MSRRRSPPADVKGLLLFPGAGSSSANPALVAIERAVGPLACERADFPYRLAGRKAPDRPPILLSTVRQHAAALADRLAVATGNLVLGGRSMGGRMCSIVAAGGTDGAQPTDDPALPVAGLALVSYPLHPPGRPDRPRTEHLPRLTVPCLFVHGTRDPFGSPDELEEATLTIPGPVTHVWIDGGRHELKGADTTVAEAVRDWLGGLSGAT